MKSRLKVVKQSNRYADEFKRKVAQEYLSGRFSYSVCAEEYGLRDKSVVREFVRWYRQKYELSDTKEPESMSKTKIKMTSSSESSSAEALEKRIKELESQLRLTSLKVEALETMIDIAEETLQVDIRKKSGSQRSKK